MAVSSFDAVRMVARTHRPVAYVLADLSATAASRHDGCLYIAGSWFHLQFTHWIIPAGLYYLHLAVYSIRGLGLDREALLRSSRERPHALL